MPHIRVRNEADQPVLLLFGEELRGAKQNRIPNVTFLVPPKRELIIDVSCVEAGRWGRRTRVRRGARVAAFEESASLVSQRLRRVMGKRVAMARAVGDGFSADQGEVWDEISLCLDFAGVSSPTSSYEDYLDTRATDLEEIRKAFRPRDGQVGFVAVIGAEVAGIEAIGPPEVFAACFDRLVDSYAIDAIHFTAVSEGDGGEAPASRFREPETFLAALRAAPVDPAPSLGLGEDLRIESDRVEGCALAAAGELVHLTAAPTL